MNSELMWESVVHANAAERRGTHATKNRALVSGGGKKPWRQKGTGRAQRRLDPNAAVAPRRHRVRAAAAQLRFRLPKKVERGALRAALAQKMKDGALVVVDELVGRGDQDEGGRGAAQAARRQGKAVLVDVAVDEKLSRSVRNIPGVALVPSARLTARDVMDAAQVVATQRRAREAAGGARVRPKCKMPHATCIVRSALCMTGL